MYDKIMHVCLYRQCPLGLPYNSTILGITFCKLPMYHLHTSGVSVIQNLSMPALSSSRFLGLYAVLKYCFIESHTLSGLNLVIPVEMATTLRCSFQKILQ